MKNNIETGKIGENIAEQYLIKSKYLILARNHQENKYEIDIIALNNQKNIIFCEVKTINKESAGNYYLNEFMPEDHLNRSKFIKLVRGAELFLMRHPKIMVRYEGWRIDLIAVELLNGRLYDLRHYKNI